MFRTPEQRSTDREFSSGFFGKRYAFFFEQGFPAQQLQAQTSFSFGLCSDLQCSGSEIIRKQRPQGKISYGSLRQHVKEYAAENAGEAVKILILNTLRKMPEKR